MKTKRMLSALLAFLLMAAVLAACSQGGEPKESTPAQTNDETVPTTEPDETAYGNGKDYVYPTIPDNLDFDGKTYTIYTSADNGHMNYYQAEEESSDQVEMAAYKRYINVEDKLGITFDILSEPGYNTAAENMMILTSSGEYFADLAVLQSVYLQINMASTGALYNWLDLKDVCDFSQPYWNQSMIDNMSINGVMFAASSDYVFREMMGLVFNKEILTDEKIAYPYDMVEDGTWTLDKFLEMTAGLTREINGDSILDENDRYGWRFAYRDYLTTALYASGMKVITIGENDYPEILNDLPKLTTLVEKMYDLIYDKNRTIPVFEGNQAIVYENGHAVFDLRTISSYLRDLEFDYGIVPFPKFDETQEKYYSNTFDFLLNIPITVEDPAFTGLVIELLSAESRGDFLPAVMDNLMDQKVAQTEQEAKIIRMLYNNCVYDLGYVYGNWNNICFTIPWMMRDKTTDVNRWYDENAPQYRISLDKLYDVMMSW